MLTYRAVPLLLLVLAARLAQAQPGQPPAAPLTLADVQALAARGAPDLAAAEAAIAQARGELMAARAYPGPFFEVGAARARGDDGRGTESEVAIRQPLDLFGRLAARRDVAEAAVAAEESARDQVGLVLRGMVRIAFAEALAAERALTTAREDLAAAAELEQLVSRRADLGEAREVDRLRFGIERHRAEARVESLEVARQAGRRALDILAGGALPANAELAAETAPPTVPPIDVALAAVERHARLRIADAIVRQREAELRLALANRRPDVEIGVAREEELDKVANGVQVGIGIPLFGWNRGAVAAARAAVERARAERAAIVRELSGEISTAHAELEAATKRLQRLESELLPRSRRGVEIAELAFRHGETSLLDLLDVRRTHIALQQEQLDALLEMAAAQARLEQLTGGSTSDGMER